MMLNVGVEVSQNANGLSVSLADCSFHTERVNVIFSGGMSWLYKHFTGTASNSIRQKLDSTVCEEIGKSMGSLERKLQNVPEYSHISSLIDWDYSIAAAPLITEQSIEVDFKGEFFNPAGPQEVPDSPAPFSLPEQNDRMLLFGVSEFVPNSAAFVYYRAGALSCNLTDDSKIPEQFPIRLNTQSFKLFAPELQKRFPNTPMALKVFARLPPRLHIQSSCVQLRFPGAVQAFVLPKGSSEVPVFLLHADINVTAQIFVSGKNISANLTLTNCNLTLAHSEVGAFSVNKLETLLNASLKSVILPQINRKFNEGYPLPTLYKTSLKDPVINIQEGFLVIATDVLYGA
ncbi:lipopolysaccharide-binding protein-like [Antechinus flavipes]|uniref:lipopolysaccharide-binding protein-like n=1 Tax=Antechinus flavipes TaxID=38775 RepID=UPI0022355EC9|nr:lipopolysaccharide-binding protein-like [Antechinus flavipes]